MNENIIQETDPDAKTIKAPNLQLITGGRGGEGNWLGDLSVGSVFLTRPKRRDPQAPAYVLTEFQLIYKTPDVQFCRLVTGTETNNPIYIWVSSSEFSLYNELKRLLADGADIVVLQDEPDESSALNRASDNDKETSPLSTAERSEAAVTDTDNI